MLDIVLRYLLIIKYFDWTVAAYFLLAADPHHNSHSRFQLSRLQ